MLVFIIPLRSRAVSRDWEKVSALCARTVASCCRQQNGDHRTVLVCREAPALPGGLKNLTVIEENFPIPKDKSEQMKDKYRKIQRGLIEIRTLAPFFWMKVDSDDCVSNRLAGFVQRNASGPGWLFHRGWIHEENCRTAYWERTGFFKVCGTSSILACRKPEELPGSMDEPLEKFPYLSTPHNQLDQLASGPGNGLAGLPFAGAIYCTGNGENWTGSRGVRDYRSKKWMLRRLFNTRLVTQHLKAEFGLTPPCRSFGRPDPPPTQAGSLSATRDR